MKIEELQKKMEKFPGSELTQVGAKEYTISLNGDSMTSKNIWNMWVWLKEKKDLVSETVSISGPVETGKKELIEKVTSHLDDGPMWLPGGGEVDIDAKEINEEHYDEIDLVKLFRENIGKKIRLVRTLYKDFTSVVAGKISEVNGDIISIYESSGSERHVRISDIITYKLWYNKIVKP